MSGTVWTKFYWSDWESDPALRLCSFSAQGLWMRMLCIAASHDPIGYVCVAGRSLGVTDLARLTGASETDVGALIAELEQNGVCSRDRQGRVYSRRMVRDAKASAIAKKNGKLGGNPTLSKDRGNPNRDNPRHKPRLKTQEPYASSKVEGPLEGPSNLTDATDAARLEGATPPALKVVEIEPLEQRKALAAEVLQSLHTRRRA